MNGTRQFTTYGMTAVAAIYVLLLSWLTLAPDPWWIFGSTGRSAEHSVDFTLADYVQHAMAYGVLGILLAANGRVSERWVTQLAAFGLCHAVGTECLQYFVPSRTCSVVDGLANVAGVTIGWYLLRLALRPAARVLSRG